MKQSIFLEPLRCTIMVWLATAALAFQLRFQEQYILHPGARRKKRVFGVYYLVYKPLATYCHAAASGVQKACNATTQGDSIHTLNDAPTLWLTNTTPTESTR